MICVWFSLFFVFSVFLLHQHVFIPSWLIWIQEISRLESYDKWNRKPFCSQAVKMVRGEMGLKNVEIMIPFVRTLDMAKDVNEVLESWLTKGLKWLVVSSMFLFSPLRTTWENDPIWLIFFQMGWNHQLDSNRWWTWVAHHLFSKHDPAFVFQFSRRHAIVFVFNVWGLNLVRYRECLLTKPIFIYANYAKIEIHR